MASAPNGDQKPQETTKDDRSDSKPAAGAPSSPSMLKGASLLITLQLVSRLATFTANQLLLRFLTAPLLGLSAQLEVYYLSVLFFARESLRVAIQRQGPSSKSKDERQAVAKESQAVVNLGYLAIGLGVLVSVGLGWMYLGWADKDVPWLSVSVQLYGLAAIVELLSEPCFVLMQTRLQFGTRAAAESIATFLRCAVVFGSAVWAVKSDLDLGVLPFALGQMTYGVSVLAVYLISGLRLASDVGFSILPKALGSAKDSAFVGYYFYRPTMNLARSMMAQSVVKHVLTQGDTFLVSFLSTPEVQGTYALANNYGGLLARLLFQPVEESSRSYFSRILSSSDPASRPSASLQSAKQSILTLLRLYLLLSIIIITLGPFASKPLLAIVAGKRWLGSGADQVLALYCLYIPFLAINGIAESFVASVATETEVHVQSLWMGAFSAVFAGSAVIFMSVFSLGATGLVIANAINMLCRIVWSGVFINKFFNKHGVDFGFSALDPGLPAALSVCTAAIMQRMDITKRGEEAPLQTLVKIAGFAIPLLLSIAFTERKLLKETLQSIRNRRAKK